MLMDPEFVENLFLRVLVLDIYLPWLFLFYKMTCIKLIPSTASNWTGFFVWFFFVLFCFLIIKQIPMFTDL